MEAPVLVWTDDFATGHKGLDEEHRALVAAINDINAAERTLQSTETITALARRLKTLAERHYQHENLILHTINSSPLPKKGERQAILKAMVDASLSDHLASHGRSLARLNDIIRDIRSALRPAEQNVSLELAAWFVAHVNNHDIHLKEVFKVVQIGTL